MNQQELQQLTLQYVNLENQIKVLELRKREIEKVLEQLQNYQGKVYRLIGGIIIEGDKEKILEEFKEEQEIINARLKVLKTQLEKIKKILESAELEGSESPDISG
jgi:chaperonin cofactor prefoldin